MTNNKVCRVCGELLNSDNWSPSNQKKGNCICKECNREYHRLYRKANKDKLNARAYLHRAANRDKLNAEARLYRKNNPEKYKANYIRAQRKNGQLPMNENKDCAAHYGVYINERLLKHYFNDVEVMPYGNPGYDFICNNGWKIDGKSSFTGDKGYWQFTIRHNTTADYFFCVAYDNRKDKNIIRIWILPGDKFSHLVKVKISKSTINKWAEYEQDINKIITCCDSMKAQ